jgi:predicted RND superfamily exporter protein
MFADAPAMDPAEIIKRKTIALQEPMLVHRLISTTGHVAAVNIELNLPEDQTLGSNEAVQESRKLRDRFEEKYPDIKVHITGVTPLNHAFEEVGRSDAGTLMPLMFVIILVLVGLMLRSVSSTLVTLSIILVGVTVTIGVVGWAGIQLNNVNSVAPIVILTLAVADCVHVLSHYLSARRKGMEKEAAMVDALDVNFMPVFLTSLTTLVGFLSMNASDSPPFQEFGTIAAIGVFFTWLFTLTLLPQLAIWFSGKAPAIDTERAALFRPIADFTIRHPRKLFYGCLAVALFCMSFIGNNNLNDDNFGYFSKNIEVRKGADFTEANLNGVNLIEYAMDSGEENGISDVDYLAKVDAFAQWYRQQPEVTHVFTFTDTLKRLNQNMHADDPAYYRLPESRELASQYQLLFEMSLPFGMDLNNQLNVDRSALRITVSIAGVRAREILALEQRAQEWLRRNAPEIASVGASPSIMFANIGQRNIDSMIKGTIIATLLISITLVFALGSWKLGILSLIPNAFPAAMMLGIWGALIGEVNLAVAVVFSVTLGIVVDDTIHFLAKYLRNYRESGNVEQAIHYAFGHVGAALLTTTVVLATGFGILALSDFKVNSTLGIMVASTIVIALAFDLLFLPAMLMMLNKLIHPQQPQAQQETTKPADTAAPGESGTATLAKGSTRETA